ncbi:MAG: hypothetical protein WC091_25010 [Sulfuricellaceae bacterium]
MSREHFKLSAVTPLEGYRLRLTYADDCSFEVDLTEWVKNTKALAVLKDGALFDHARVGVGGWSVDWIEDEIDLGSDNLRNLGVEQAGGIGHERIWNWLYETGLSLEQGAEALGISRKMLIYYRDGEKPIPRHIWLACLGWDAVRPQGSRLPKNRPTAQQYAVLHA